MSKRCVPLKEVNVALAATLLAVMLTACGEMAIPENAGSSSETSSEGFFPRYKPNAEFVVASELSLESLSAAEMSADEVVLREHTFSNHETYKYMTIGNEVVDADVILGTVEELEGAFLRYEEYLVTGNTDINAQGAMYKPYCDFRIIFCFVDAGDPWPRNTVYFDLGSIYGAFTDEQTRIVWAAIKHITDSTNLIIKGTDDRAIRNKIKFTNNANDGCVSRVGMVGGVQQLNLADGCFGNGTPIHELGHAVGMMHEHSRTDRDTKIDILVNNLTRFGLEVMSQKYVHDYRTGYDFNSIMHYDQVVSDPKFVKPSPSGLRIFTTKGYTGTIRGTRLTASDIQAINQRYR